MLFYEIAIEALPLEIQRQFTLMQELEGQSHGKFMMQSL